MNEISANELPTPHRCPWWVQYMLVNPLRKILEPTDKLLGPHVEPGMVVIEPGCGFGYISIGLAHLLGPQGKVVATDIEPRAIARLQKRAKKAGVLDRIDARTCDQGDLGLADYKGKADLITVIHTLHEFEDLPGFLAQAVTLLKPSGRMLVVEPKGHVKPEHFAAELECCKQAGFQELSRPAVGGKRMATLLKPALPV